MILVLIEWPDPAFSSAHWEDREPFTEKTVDCVTCGILLHEDKESVHVILNLNLDFYSQGIVIPRKLIKRMRKLHLRGE